MNRLAKKGSWVVTGLAIVAWTSVAQAHPGYPMKIDSTLNLAGNALLENAYPPMGCQLCHNSAGGGDALREFGNLMVENYGLSSNASTEEDGSLVMAIALLQQQDPEAVKDLEGGVNPNDDPVVFENALPTPEYGCSAGATGGARGTGSQVLVGFGAAVAAIARRSKASRR